MGSLGTQAFFRAAKQSGVCTGAKGSKYWAGISSSENTGQAIKGRDRSQSHYVFQIRCFSEAGTLLFRTSYCCQCCALLCIRPTSMMQWYSSLNPECFRCLLFAPAEPAKTSWKQNVGLDDVVEGDSTHISNAIYHFLPQPLVQMKKCGPLLLGLRRAFTSFLLPSHGWMEARTAFLILHFPWPEICDLCFNTATNQSDSV